MFIDPPRHHPIPGLSNNNKDYSILVLLWAFSIIIITILISVLTIPYYFNYKVPLIRLRGGFSFSLAPFILLSSSSHFSYTSFSSVLTEQNLRQMSSSSMTKIVRFANSLSTPSNFIVTVWTDAFFPIYWLSI